MAKGLMDFSERESLAPYIKAVSVEVATATKDPCRAIYVGVAGNYEFFVNNEWIHFKWTTTCLKMEPYLKSTKLDTKMKHTCLKSGPYMP